MRYIFVITNPYDDLEILGVQEIIPDMKEVQEKKDKEEYDSILYKCVVKTLVQFSDFGPVDLSKNPVLAADIYKYNYHQQIAWMIFNDEEWYKDNYDGPIDEPDYY